MKNGVADSTPPVSLKTACTQPCKDIMLYSTATVETISYTMQSTITGGRTFDSSQIDINIVCTATTTAITATIAASTVTDIQVDSVSPADRFTFTPFTCSVQACCVGAHALTYQVSSVNSGSPTAISGISGPTFDSPNYFINPTSTASVQAYTYYIYAENGWGTTKYSVQANLNVVCSSSITVSEGAYPNSETDSQTGIMFVLPALTTSNANCPIVSVRIIEGATDPSTNILAPSCNPSFTACTADAADLSKEVTPRTFNF